MVKFILYSLPTNFQITIVKCVGILLVSFWIIVWYFWLIIATKNQDVQGLDFLLSGHQRLMLFKREKKKCRSVCRVTAVLSRLTGWGCTSFSTRLLTWLNSHWLWGVFLLGSSQYEDWIFLEQMRERERDGDWSRELSWSHHFWKNLRSNTPLPLLEVSHCLLEVSS